MNENIMSKLLAGFFVLSLTTNLVLGLAVSHYKFDSKYWQEYYQMMVQKCEDLQYKYNLLRFPNSYGLVPYSGRDSFAFTFALKDEFSDADTIDFIRDIAELDGEFCGCSKVVVECTDNHTVTIEYYECTSMPSFPSSELGGE